MRLAALLIPALVACSSPDHSDAARTPAAKMPFEFVPPVTPGRWRQVMTITETQRQPQRFERDQRTRLECVSTIDPQRLALVSDGLCVSERSFRPTAEGLVYEASCAGGRLRTVVTGDLRRQYTADRMQTYAENAGGWRVHVEASYEGACRGDE